MAVIRAMREEDLPATFEVLEPLAGEAFCGDRLDLCDRLAQVVAGHAAGVLTLDLAGHVLGAALVTVPEPGAAELALVWVAATHRRRGLARAMLSTFTPVWAEATITAELPERAEVAPVTALLSQFAFTPVAGTGGRALRARRVRRTTGRASLAPVRI